MKIFCSQVMEKAFDWNLWKLRNEAQEENGELENLRRIQQALLVARNLCDKFLGIDPDLSRVVLFGSLARLDCRDLRFDIDIVVEDTQSFGALLNEAEGQEFPVDLHEWESLKPQIQEHIRKEGVVLNDLKSEFASFKSKVERVRMAQGRLTQAPDDTLLWYSFAYLVHNLYNNYEAYFYRISQFYENGLPKEIQETDKETFQELRAFRHLIRHLYDRDLDPVRILLFQVFADKSIEVFPRIHEGFSLAVKTMADVAR